MVREEFVQDSFVSIPTIALERVSGGAAPATYEEFVQSQRAAIAKPYKEVVCATTGVKGGPAFANQVYGKDRTTTFDMTRAAKTLRTVCSAGSRLPAQAPPSPF
jgi:hypothetical protein